MGCRLFRCSSMAITTAPPSLAMSATVEPRSRPSSSASSSPPPPPSLLVGFLMDLVGYVEDKAAASPCDLPTREYAPSSPCACQVLGGFFVRLLSKRRNSFLRLVDQLEKGKWVVSIVAHLILAFSWEATSWFEIVLDRDMGCSCSLPKFACLTCQNLNWQKFFQNKPVTIRVRLVQRTIRIMLFNMDNLESGI